jgi:YVTN family beta-propeller protein
MGMAIYRGFARGLRGLLPVALIALATAGAAEARVAYVSNLGGNSITPVDTSTNTPGTPIAVNSPRGMALTPDGATLYVVNQLSNSVTPVDTQTGTAGAAIAVGAQPVTIAITPDGATAYVANFTSNNVTPIDIATNTAGPAIAVGLGPVAVAVTPDGATAYVANRGAATVTPIDTATNTAGPAIAVGSGPFAIAVTPDGSSAYVANTFSDDVTPIDTQTNTAGAAIAAGDSPGGIAITPDGSTAYVANTNSNNVTPIDTQTGTAGAPIAVGSSPFPIAVTPDGSTVYVANVGSSTVTPIDTQTGTAGAPIAVGSNPFGVAVTPNQPPSAVFAATSATAGAATSLEASASSDSDGTVAGFEWDFGDGQAETTSGPTTSHVYASPGTYTVTLTVTDDEGCSTAFVFTGQTASCNGSSVARVQHQVTVTKASPTLAASASGNVVLGGEVHDAASLAGGSAPGGQITFRLFGPGDADCSGPPAFTDTVPVSGNGAYRSASFTPAGAGSYRWSASYSGDSNNDAVSTACEDSAQAIVVADPPPAAPAQATPPPALPEPLRQAIERFALTRRCVRPSPSGMVQVALNLRLARPGPVRVRIDRAVGTGARKSCPRPKPGRRFTGSFRRVEALRRLDTRPVAALVTRRRTLRLRLLPGLYRITVRAFTSENGLTRPARRFLRVLG